MNPEMTKAMAASQARKWLLKSIESHLVPAIIQLRFTQEIERTLKPPIDRRHTLAFPLPNLVRIRDSSLDMIQIQFAPYRFNAFRINASIRLGEAIGNDHTLSQIRGAVPNDRFEMYAHRRLWMFWWLSWFSVRPRPFGSPKQEDYEKLALRVASYVPELEDALREGKLDPHMRHVVISHRPPPQPR
jgi:hypothetical protein